jgi:hypothetical protein
MNKIITTSVVDPSILQPFTTKSLDFLQSATRETLTAIIAGLNPTGFDTGNPIMIYGGTKTLYSGSTCYSYAAGYVYIDGEICYMPSAILELGAQTDVVTITTTNDATADPVTFSDGVARNVHNVRRLTVSVGASGSGTYDFSEIQTLNPEWQTYTPTLSAYNSGGSLISGGFTGTAAGRWLFKNDTLFIKMSVTSMSVNSAAVDLVFSLPMSVPSPYNAEGFNLCRYGGVSTFEVMQVFCGLRHTGQGDGLTVKRLDNSDFSGVVTDKIDFSIAIGYRKDNN